MKAKRIISIATAAMLTVSLMGCGNSSSAGSSSATQAASDQSQSTGTAAGGSIANKDKPIAWFNKQPSNSTTGELDMQALHFNDKTYYVGFDANQGAELQGKMALNYIKKHAKEIDRNGDGIIG